NISNNSRPFRQLIEPTEIDLKCTPYSQTIYPDRMMKQRGKQMPHELFEVNWAKEEISQISTTAGLRYPGKSKDFIESDGPILYLDNKLG
ncbi:hypothetical protein WA026_000867, partial [Henosepilachna vigintioctopunctata]